jgi:hypothetical protein
MIRPRSSSTIRATGAAITHGAILRLIREYAGRRLWRLQRALRSEPAAGAYPRGGCFAHARRKFFELADVDGRARKKSRGEKAWLVYPIALEAVQKLDALYAIERGINGQNRPNVSRPAKNSARR